jgi:hypothetical protein
MKMVNPLRTLLYELFVEPVTRVFRRRTREAKPVATDSLQPLPRPLLDDRERARLGHTGRKAS